MNRIKKKQMKKRIAIILSVLVAVVLIFGIYIIYIYKFKEYNITDPQIDRVMDNPYAVILPNGTKLLVEEVEDKDFELKRIYSERKSTSMYNDEIEEDTTSTISPAFKYGNRVTVAEIKKKYERVFTDLESQVDEKVNMLISIANDELRVKKEGGERVKPAYFYNKYMGALSGVELQTDLVFEGIISSLEKDLEANDYNKAYSSSFMKEYETKKEERHEKISINAVKVK